MEWSLCSTTGNLIMNIYYKEKSFLIGLLILAILSLEIYKWTQKIADPRDGPEFMDDDSVAIRAERLADPNSRAARNKSLASWLQGLLTIAVTTAHFW